MGVFPRQRRALDQWHSLRNQALGANVWLRWMVARKLQAWNRNQPVLSLCNPPEPTMKVPPITRSWPLCVVLLAAAVCNPASAFEAKWSQGQDLHCRIVPYVKANGVVDHVVTCGAIGV